MRKLLPLICATFTTASAQAPPRLIRARHTIDSLAGTVSGRVGVAAMIIETGEVVSTRGNERFPIQSVSKVPIAMAVLHRVDAGKLKLSEDVHIKKSDLVPGIHSPIRELTPNGTTLSTRELLRSAIVESDGVAFDMLLIWAPPADVTRMVRKLKVDSMAIVATERAMVADPKLQSRNWSTPLATVQLLRALQVGHALSAPSRVLLMGWLAESTPNDVGVVMLPNGQHLATVVFFKDSKATKAQREATVAKIARAALDAATRDKR